MLKSAFEMAILQISSVESLIGITELINEIKNIRGGETDSDINIKQLLKQIKIHLMKKDQKSLHQNYLNSIHTLDMSFEKKTSSRSI